MNRLLIISFFLLTNFLGYSQENTFTITSHFKIQSVALGEEREIVVHVPLGYSYFNLNYPVLYVLDGETHFNHIVGAISTLSSNQQIPSMIVVGVLNGNRIKDFTPTHSKNNIFNKPIEHFSSSGGSQSFIDFFEKELIPKINKEYKVTGTNLIFGHSLGGLFCLTTLSTKPNLFSAYFAIDPSSWWDHRYISQKIDWGNLKLPAKKHLYLSLSNDGGNQEESFNLLVKKLNSSKLDSISIEHANFPDENHGTIVHPSIIDGLKWYYKQVKWTSGNIVLSHSQFEKDLSKFEGEFKFKFNPLESISFKKDLNQLQFNIGGQNYNLVQYGDNLFYCKTNSCFFKFIKDENGLITSLVAQMPNYIYTEESIDFGKKR
jgi:predicted alpha/beta superfamily hydrolase